MEPVVLPAETIDTTTSNTRAATIPGRVTSVDVYRGFVMLLMMGEVLSFEPVPPEALWSMSPDVPVARRIGAPVSQGLEIGLVELVGRVWTPLPARTQ